MMSSTKKKHSKKVIVTPVFKTKEQEKLFAKCAAESMSTTSFLNLETTTEDDSSTDKVIVTPVFKTKEQEELFAKCAAESMSITAVLTW